MIIDVWVEEWIFYLFKWQFSSARDSQGQPGIETTNINFTKQVGAFDQLESKSYECSYAVVNASM